LISGLKSVETKEEGLSMNDYIGLVYSLLERYYLLLIFSSLKNTYESNLKELCEYSNKLNVFDSLKSRYDESQTFYNVLIKEKELLLESNDEKDKKIEKLKIQISDSTDEETRAKKKFDDLKKEYDLFLKNSKNADQIKLMQNKINTLNEEKSMIQQTQTNIITELNNEIKQLKNSLSKLNEENIQLKGKFYIK